MVKSIASNFKDLGKQKRSGLVCHSCLETQLLGTKHLTASVQKKQKFQGQCDVLWF